MTHTRNDWIPVQVWTRNNADEKWARKNTHETHQQAATAYSCGNVAGIVNACGLNGMRFDDRDRIFYVPSGRQHMITFPR